jgi:hypothetical protein
MTSIDEMYSRVLDLVRDIKSAEYMYGSEGSTGVTIGSTPDVPQVIEVEFHGEVPEGLDKSLLQAVNGTGWEFVDEDDVFNGDNSGGGLITISREVDPEGVGLEEFDREDEL